MATQSSMAALTELCNLIAQNPSQFTEKLEWICSRCPPEGSLSIRSHRLTRLHLNAILAFARFISKCPSHTDHGPRSQVIGFLQSIQASFRQLIWPQSFEIDFISAFYSNFLTYVAKAVELSSDFTTEVADIMGGIVIAATIINGEAGICRVFLKAVSQNCPPISPEAAENLVSRLLEQFSVAAPTSPRETAFPISENSSSQSSPLGSHHLQPNGSASLRNEASNASGSLSNLVLRVVDDVTTASSRGAATDDSTIGWRSSVDQLGVNLGYNDSGGGGAAWLRQRIASFEEESMEILEKQEIAFRLLWHIVNKIPLGAVHLDQVKMVSNKQLQLQRRLRWKRTRRKPSPEKTSRERGGGELDTIARELLSTQLCANGGVLKTIRAKWDFQ